MKLGLLERSEVELAAVVEAFADAAGKGADLYGLLADALNRICTLEGIEAFVPGDGARTWLAVVDDAVWREPHALGWLHQHVGASDRAESFAAHTADEAKHASQTVSTQLYTPRWIADFLVRRALDAIDDPLPTVLDPACGGGQMLLAAFEALVERGHPPGDVAARLRGIELDPVAAQVTRWNLMLAAARAIGARDRGVEGAIEENVRVADALVDEVAPADVVVTNPPYMGSRSMPADLKSRLRRDFAPCHGDLAWAFTARCQELTHGALAILAQQTVWYLARFEAARTALLEPGPLLEFAHFGPHVFRTLSGEKANVVGFVQRHGGEAEATRFHDLRDIGDPEKMRAALADESHVSTTPIEAFAAIPGRPLAHWLPDPLLSRFVDWPRLGDIADIPGSQNKTGANRRFVRRFDEVPPSEIRNADGLWDRGSDDARWIFYSKGGRYAPFWGNWHYVVDWSDEARDFYRDNPTSNLVGEQYRFRRGLCYTDFGGRQFNARWMPAGCLFDMAGPAIFVEGDDPDRLYGLVALLNTTPVRAVLNALNPSIHYQVRDLRNLPVPEFTEREWDELATAGRKLVASTRKLHHAAPGDPLHVEDCVVTADEIEEIDSHHRRIDERVCASYAGAGILEPAAHVPEHAVSRRITIEKT